MDGIASNHQIYSRELNKKVIILNMGGRKDSLLNHELLKAGFKVQVLTDPSLLKLLLKGEDVSIVLIAEITNKSALFGFLPSLRQAHDIPLVVIFEENDVIDKVHAIDLGADICFGKPVDDRELTATVRGLLRRTSSLKYHSLLCRNRQIKSNYPILFGDYSFNPQTQSLLRANYPARKLTHSESRILEVLILNRGNPVSRELLHEYIQKNGKHLDLFDRRIDVHVASLRKKLNDLEHKIIKTVRNEGYEFIATLKDG